MGNRVVEAKHSNISYLDINEYTPVDDGVVLAKLVGKFSTSKESSRNGRLYTPELWKDIINAPIVKELIESKMFLGELSHPPVETEYLTEVQIGNASHNITSLEFDDKTQEVYGTLDILDTPSGRIANTLIKYGSKLGISSRGAMMDDGSYIMDDSRMTPSNYYFITFDLVALPGIKGARLDPVFESLSPKDVSNSSRELESAIHNAIEAKDEDALRVLEGLATGNKKLSKRITEALHDRSFSDNKETSDNSKQKDPSRSVDTNTDVIEDELDASTDQVDEVVDVDELPDESVDEELEEFDEDDEEVTESGDMVGTQVSDVGLAMVGGINLLDIPFKPKGDKIVLPINDRAEVRITNESVELVVTNDKDGSEVVVDPDKFSIYLSKDEVVTEESTGLTQYVEEFDQFLESIGVDIGSDQLLDDEDIPLSDEDEGEDILSIRQAIERIGDEHKDVISTLESANAKLVSDIASLSSNDNENLRIKSELRKANESLQSRVSQLTDEVRKLKLMRRSTVNEASGIRSKMAKTNEINQKLIRTVESLKERNTQLSKELAKARRELDVRTGTVLESRSQARVRDLASQFQGKQIVMKSAVESVGSLGYRTESDGGTPSYDTNAITNGIMKKYNKDKKI